VLSQIAKGSYRGRAVGTNKPGFIRNLINSWPDESTIVWCLYNAEQERLARELPNAASITGATPYERRGAIIEDFKAGRIKTLITKPKILGFGLNLHIVTRQVFSGLQDSYESYYQAVKRSNRYGAVKPLNVHIPFTDIEAPMIENVMRKSRMVQKDTEQQERIFRDACKW
jgi:superfamily II DNA/RNA helicase